MSSLTYGSRIADTASWDALAELALDLRWSFNHSTDKLWKWISPELWESTHNPWVVLQTISRRRLEAVLADPSFQAGLAEELEDRRRTDGKETWFRENCAGSALKLVAYFSMEFMLAEALPIYSGGLGNVAGDQLKAASNLGVPVIAVGLLYQQGYFRQEIDAHGQQRAFYPYNDPGQLPIQPLRDANGEWLRLTVDFPGPKLWVRAWQVQVGRAKLYLLDTNDPANIPAYRGITGELYGGDSELRLKQEQVLGIGGWRLLRALGLRPEVCHLNEGHAAFAVLERARSYIADAAGPRPSFDQALTITRAGNLFTTHTPVDAGFDRFSLELMETYLKEYAEEQLGISFGDLMALGRRNPSDWSEPFNMAYLAIRGSGGVNGVSQLHGAVSRKLFQGLFPRWPEAEVPVSYVTNGVHAPSWDSAEADRLWEENCGKERWRGAQETIKDDMQRAKDVDLWHLRCESRKKLVKYVRLAQVRQLAEQGVERRELAVAAQALDPDALTLGFARRFATYKRPNLLLHDAERLVRILTNQQRPVQLVLAGKAHPQDWAGQEMIRQWCDFARRPEAKQRVVFLADYDMLMAEQLVRGVDLWINTPRRPWEASGTSGMKVLVNGGLNLSELDGWWAEAYSPEVGWAIGDRREHDSDPAWDAAEAEQVYALLENEVVPQFYTRDANGIPPAWVGRMRESMSRLTPAFSTNRVVRQYTQEHYLEAAKAFGQRSASQGALGADLLHWQGELAKHWAALRFGSATMEVQGHTYLFTVQVFLDGIDPDAVAVELYAEGPAGENPVRHRMDRSERMAGEASGFVYTARIPGTRAVSDYTPRLIPSHDNALVPLEAPFIEWHDSPSWRG